MRKRFEAQLAIGQIPISEVKIHTKNATALDELLAALKEVYCNEEYNEKVFSILESYITKGKKETGRKGMNLWNIFVLSQIRLCLNLNYEMLTNMANYHRLIRELMGIETEFGYEKIQFEYQNIYDNVSLINDNMVKELNEVIVEFGHKEVFKKKDVTVLRLKTDSFVVESNVHFPTDYNLLWDSSRKVLDSVAKLLEKYRGIKGWRKLKNWRYEIKGLMRELGKTSKSGGKGKEKRVQYAAKRYLKKANMLVNKVKIDLPTFPLQDLEDLFLILAIEYFIKLMEKHIDLVERRIIKGETIPHEEKLFSIFETYTQWIKKGKSRPSVELGRKLAITTDQFNLIVDYRVMGKEQDRDIVISVADSMLQKYKIFSWSFDKGFWRKENKELLQLEVPKVIMPKLGKRNQKEEEEEKSRSFKRLKNKHSAIESNINELENRGLDRCPDKGFDNFKRYIGLGVCAYNLKKLGRKILTERHKAEMQELQKSA